MATSNKNSERGPTYRKASTIEGLAIPQIGLGVLSLVKPAGVKLEVLKTSSGKSTSITIWDSWTRSRTWSPSTCSSLRSAMVPSPSTAATRHSRT
eukprot:1680739-Prymnesium_polylepis.2